MDKNVAASFPLAVRAAAAQPRWRRLPRSAMAAPTRINASAPAAASPAPARQLQPDSLSPLLEASPLAVPGVAQTFWVSQVAGAVQPLPPGHVPVTMVVGGGGAASGGMSPPHVPWSKQSWASWQVSPP